MEVAGLRGESYESLENVQYAAGGISEKRALKALPLVPFGQLGSLGHLGSLGRLGHSGSDHWSTCISRLQARNMRTRNLSFDSGSWRSSAGG